MGRIKGLLGYQCQNSDAMELDSRSARSHLVVWAFVSLQNILAPSLNIPQPAAVFSRLRLKLE
jgi:hypothetical protein